MIAFAACPAFLGQTDSSAWRHLLQNLPLVALKSPGEAPPVEPLPRQAAQPRLHAGLLRRLHMESVKLYRTNMGLLSIGLPIYLPYTCRIPAR
jgi:hypothetical protein